MDNRIIGTVFTRLNAEDAKKFIGMKGFFLYDVDAAENLDFNVNVKVGVLKEVYNGYRPFRDTLGWNHDVFIPEMYVDTAERPCSDEVYETSNENTIKELLDMDEKWWSDTESYKTSTGLLELKYNSTRKVMLEKRGDEVHVRCNYTVRDWRMFMVRMETER